jgi:hypothetical protein
MQERKNSHTQTGKHKKNANIFRNITTRTQIKSAIHPYIYTYISYMTHFQNQRRNGKILHYNAVESVLMIIDQHSQEIYNVSSQQLQVDAQNLHYNYLLNKEVTFFLSFAHDQYVVNHIVLLSDIVYIRLNYFLPKGHPDNHFGRSFGYANLLEKKDDLDINKSVYLDETNFIFENDFYTTNTTREGYQSVPQLISKEILECVIDKTSYTDRYNAKCITRYQRKPIQTCLFIETQKNDILSLIQQIQSGISSSSSQQQH